ncbi:chorismate mutase [Rothia sp. LK2588]|uniref:chorismate mutase n=1 Tax=Rothia sp. LK2588 TaxID=3114369 RepID=UPI0034D00FA8
MQQSRDVQANAEFDRRATSLEGTDEAVLEELFAIRRTIDNMDAALVNILAERFRATQRVGVLKAEHQLPPGDPDREAAQIQRLRSLAEAAQLDPEFAEKFLNFIISEVIQHHKIIAENHER